MSAGPGRGNLASATAAILGSLPGFSLPFVAALELAPGRSDLLLLGLSVGITPAIIVSSSVELTTVAEYGRLLGAGRSPTPEALRRFHLRVLAFALLLTAVVVPALVLAYAARSSDRTTFLTLAAAVVLTPVVSAIASTMSGECIARGAPVAPIAVQAMRSLVPAMLLLAWPGAPLLLCAAMLPVGEAARAVALGVACRRLRRRQVGVQADALAPHGLVAQALSSGVTQLGPAVDRTYLSASGAGSVSAYEISDRLVYGATQFFTMTFIYRRVAVWARLPTMEAGPARLLLRGDARTLGALAVALTVVGAAGLLACLVSGLLPVDWHTGFRWGALVMVSAPAQLFNVIGTRLLVIARRPRLMLSIAVTTVVLNAALDTLFYLLLGPVGIVVSTIVVRWSMAGVYLYLLRSLVPATVGRESVAG
jgi:hypothetical protein